MRDELVAMPLSAAVKLAGVSRRQLRYWHDNGLLTPGLYRRVSERNHVRLYEFQDLLELLVIKALLDAGTHTRVVRRVVEHLRDRGYQHPLTELRYAVEGKRVYFQHPDGSWEGDREPDQIVLVQLLKLEPLRARIRDAVTNGRDKELEGVAVRKRRVMGSKPTFAGTRTPVAVVSSYLERGATAEQILADFPHLSRADIEAAKRAMSAA